MPFINIADLVDPEDPQGRSYKQVNNEKLHIIPIGALVEIIPCEGGGEVYKGMRLYVVYHSRDCDGTPLYSLGKKGDSCAAFAKVHHGFSEENLKIIHHLEIGK